MRVFAKRLKELRSNSNMTQDELSNKLNLSIKTIMKWENAKAYPNCINLYNLCKLLHCSCDYLLGVSNENE
ncbi:MAG TPA: helix-turn-helix transcriptional regulator [Candidatus Onthoplasma faecigallinarum]|nr:helix-turn-helix transcriptional regulator [Candidatus Onthoplasma faecigallinarum]